MPPLAVVVLASGRGSNLQALIDAVADGLPIEIRAVLSNRADAVALDSARRAGIATASLDHQAYPSREAFDQALMENIDRYSPGLVVLAGFMRILTPSFVRHYLGRMLNIHPALLPKYPGLNTHQRVIDAGDTEHGASVHFVTEQVDGGPVVHQARVPVLATDDTASLAARVLEQEHRIFPEAVGWFAAGRLDYRDGQAYLDGSPLLI